MYTTYKIVCSQFSKRNLHSKQANDHSCQTCTMSRSSDDLIQSLDRAFRRITQQQNQSMEQQPETLDLECDTASECTDYEPPASRRRRERQSNKRTLVLLTSMEVSANKVPKGKQKDSKKKVGMIKEASFRKNSSSRQVIQTMNESFKKALRNLIIIK